jgi:hypothetical protein
MVSQSVRMKLDLIFLTTSQMPLILLVMKCNDGWIVMLLQAE